jgi:YD repeat-containing protein
MRRAECLARESWLNASHQGTHEKQSTAHHPAPAVSLIRSVDGPSAVIHISWAVALPSVVKGLSMRLRGGDGRVVRYEDANSLGTYSYDHRGKPVTKRSNIAGLLRCGRTRDVLAAHWACENAVP